MGRVGGFFRGVIGQEGNAIRGMPLTSTEYYVVLPNQLLIVEDLF